MSRPQPSLTEQSGTALALVLIFLLVLSPLLTTLLMSVSGATRLTLITRGLEDAYQIAEGGINIAIFKIEALLLKDYANNLTDFINAQNGLQITGTINGGSFTATVSGPVVAGTDGEFLRITCTGRSSTGRERTLEALLHLPANARALGYGLFGNYIHFDNHDEALLAGLIKTSAYSNSSILVDGGFIIDGPITAVRAVKPNLGDACNGTCKKVNDTIFLQKAQQGDGGPITLLKSAPIERTSTLPAVLPFPTFDFAQTENLAKARGTYFSAAQFNALITAAKTFAEAQPATGTPVPLPALQYPAGITQADAPVSIIRRKNSAILKTPRLVAVPNPILPLRKVPLGSPDGLLPPATDTYEIVLSDNRVVSGAADQIFFVDGDLDLDTKDRNTLIRVEGSLIVDGSLKLRAAAEILAWENRDGDPVAALGDTIYNFAAGSDRLYSRYPALAVNGSLAIDGSDTGPSRIEGVVYSLAETHLHRRDLKDSACIIGNVTADIVHNCHFFSLYYDNQARSTRGLSERTTGRTILSVARLVVK